MFKKGKIHRTEGTEVLIILEGRGKFKKNKKLNKHKKNKQYSTPYSVPKSKSNDYKVSKKNCRNNFLIGKVGSY